jgi:hypothetical protein
MAIEIVDSKGQQMVKAAPKVTGAKAVGSNIIFEKLTNQEIVGSSFVTDSEDIGSPQGYIVDIGPSIEAQSQLWGFEVGDRVILSGKFVPLPKELSKNGREIGIIDPSAIKAVLKE